MGSGVTGLHGHSVLALAANQYRLDHAHVPHQSMKVILVKVLPKNRKNVSYALVKVSKLITQGIDPNTCREWLYTIVRLFYYNRTLTLVSCVDGCDQLVTLEFSSFKAFLAHNNPGNKHYFYHHTVITFALLLCNSCVGKYCEPVEVNKAIVFKRGQDVCTTSKPQTHRRCVPTCTKNRKRGGTIKLCCRDDPSNTITITTDVQCTNKNSVKSVNRESIQVVDGCICQTC